MTDEEVIKALGIAIEKLKSNLGKEDEYYDNAEKYCYSCEYFSASCGEIISNGLGLRTVNCYTFCNRFKDCLLCDPMGTCKGWKKKED